MRFPNNTILFYSLLFTSCFVFEEEETPDNTTNLSLSLRSTGVTNVILKVSPDDSLANYSFDITRNDTTVQSYHQISRDTLLIDIGLNNNTTYLYKLYSVVANQRTVLDSLEITTLDTTSHNFEWVVHNFNARYGDLKGVKIFSENNIWVVGYLDFLDETTDNAIAWDGENWNSFDPGPGTGMFNSIFAFDENNIWAGSSLPHFWDGNEWHLYLPEDGFPTGGGRIEGIWGTSNSDMYFVGHYGYIIHFDGENFTIVADFSDSINGALGDIYGWVDEETGNKYIYVNNPIGTLFGQTGAVIRYANDDWNILWDINTPFFKDPIAVTSTTGIVGNKFVARTHNVGGSFLTVHDPVHPQLYEQIEVYPSAETQMYYSHKIKGNNVNDFFGVGKWGRFFHFNGKTSKIFEIENVGDPFFGPPIYKGVDMKDNIVALAPDNIAVVIGIRNN